jgi:hypothetical protein
LPCWQRQPWPRWPATFRLGGVVPGEAIPTMAAVLGAVIPVGAAVPGVAIPTMAAVPGGRGVAVGGKPDRHVARQSPGTAAGGSDRQPPSAAIRGRQGGPEFSGCLTVADRYHRFLGFGRLSSRAGRRTDCILPRPRATDRACRQTSTTPRPDTPRAHAGCRARPPRCRSG